MSTCCSISETMKDFARILSFCLAALTGLSGCAGYSRYQPPRILPDDRRDIAEPRINAATVAQNIFEYEVVLPTASLFDFSRHIRSLAGKKRQALNVDAWGEVQDSSWFTNRNAKHPLPLEEIARGPDTGTGPEIQGPWDIFSAKVEGFTPGFNIIDARGERYVIKFDPFGYRELTSGAEIVVGKIFHAAGYNVPENYIVTFDPAILKMKGTCLLINEKGVRCEMTVDDFDRIMQKVEPLPDGRVRALASKFLSGEKILGGFRYHGRRSDDPNDIIDHEYRRELRGLYVLCAWLKHLDIKDANSMDVYVEEDERKFIRHYMMDFGSTLGATATGPVPAFRGHETDFDLGAAFGNLFTLGLDVKNWETEPSVEFPSIGRFSAIGFEPGATDMNYDNPAFALLTNLDGYWGAKLVMSFTDEQLEVLVREGRYSDPAAEKYLLEVLKERRDMTGRYWFSRVNCLDHFSVADVTETLQELRFSDLGIRSNLWSSRQTRYRCDLRINGNLVRADFNLPEGQVIPLHILLDAAQRSAKVKKPFTARDQWEIALTISRDSGMNWGKWVKVYLRRDSESGRFVLLGLRRQD